VPEVDGLRFVAIVSVVMYRFRGFVLGGGVVPATQDLAAVVVEHEYRGVNLFYASAGLPFAAHHLRGDPAVGLKKYFVRRLTRLEPPYVLNLLICFALLVLAGGASMQTLLPHLGASLLYLHNLVFGQQSAINAVAWTLEVEVQFHCCVPLLAAIFAVRPKLVRRAILIGIILLAGLAQAAFWDAPARVKLSLLFGIQFFLTGFLLADIYVDDWNELPSSHWQWDVLSMACWPILFVPEDRKCGYCSHF